MVMRFVVITALVTMLTFGFIFGTALAITREGNCVGSASTICSKKHPPRPVAKVNGTRLVAVIVVGLIMLVSGIFAIPISFHYIRRFWRTAT